ncbi:MAG: hypothetical protein WC804_22175 [Sphingomonas sp.]|jgi:preprotein translocase subunit YajC|uniref:hypothetical protein n=1 Tax=Sphingomonas sp. TaxID=28214 RepID=UPI003564D622
MRFAASVLFLAALVPAGPAFAQAAGSAPATASAPALKLGATIYDPAGGEVGTIDTIAGDVVVVSTGTHKVSLAAKAFGTGPKGLTIALTRAQLDAAAAQAATDAAAALKVKLAPGAQVHGVGGTAVVGAVKSVGDDFVDVTTPQGDARLPITAFSIGGTGEIIIGMTAAQFEAAVAPAK